MTKEKGLVILAAGNSSRMGACKFLLKTDTGISFLEKILNDTKEFCFDKVVIVVNENTYNEVIFNLRDHLNENIIVIVNKDVSLERFYTLQLGLQQLKNFDYYFVHNADNPFINSENLNFIYDNREKTSVVVPCYNGKGGHPVMFNKKVAEYLLSAKPESRLNEELKKHNILRLETSFEEVLTDIDTGEDYFRVFGKNI